MKSRSRKSTTIEIVTQRYETSPQVGSGAILAVLVSIVLIGVGVLYAGYSGTTYLWDKFNRPFPSLPSISALGTIAAGQIPTISLPQDLDHKQQQFIGKYNEYKDGIKGEFGSDGILSLPEADVLLLAASFCEQQAKGGDETTIINEHQNAIQFSEYRVIENIHAYISQVGQLAFNFLCPEVD